MRYLRLLVPLVVIVFCSCNKNAPLANTTQRTSTNPKESLTRESFGHLPDGRDVGIFTLTNANGLKAKVTEYGAILVSLEVPDKSGKFADVTHGYDTLKGWLGNTSYLGSSVGRFSNRIRDGK